MSESSNVVRPSIFRSFIYSIVQWFAWALFVALMLLHLVCNYRAVRALGMPMFNLHRLLGREPRVRATGERPRPFGGRGR